MKAERTLVNNPLYFLEGGGEMGELARRFNWEQTSIGKPENWPQSLKTIVGVILSSRFPMFLWWGDDLIQFYNDAYRPSLGNDGKHPLALGQKGKECWPEIWDIIYPLINQVRETGVSTWSEDQLLPIFRNGKMEDVYWTFSYGAVKGESGNVEGVHVVCTETTEKINNFKRLQESETRFRTMAEATDVLIAVANENKEATYFNNAWADLTGRPVEELLKLGWADLIHEADREVFVNSYLNAFDNQQPFAGEFRVLSKDRQYRWLLAKGPVRFQADGSFAGHISSCIDITDRKKTEEDNQKFAAIITASDEFIAMAEPEEEISYLNPAALNMLGWKDYKGRKLIDCIYPGDRPAALEILQQLRTKGSFQQEIRFWNEQTGEPFWLQWNGMALKDAGTNAVTTLATVSPDITERKNAIEALKNSEQRFRNLIAESTVAIALLTGTDMLVEIANQAMLHLWGKDATVIGKTLLEIMPEQLDQRYFQMLQQVFVSGETVSEEAALIEIEKNGKMVPYYRDFSYKALRNERGAVYGILAMIVDVTERVVAQEQLIQSEKRFRNLITEATVATALLTGEEMIIELANEPMLHLWGRDQSVIGKPLLDVMPEIASQPFPALLNKVFTTGGIYNMHDAPVSLIRQGKLETMYRDFSYKAIRGGKNEITSVLVMSVDVTEKVLAREKLMKSEQRYRTLIEESTVAAALYTGSEMRIQYANETMISYWGKDHAVIGKTFGEALPELNDQPFPALLEAVFATGKTYVGKEEKASLIVDGKLQSFYFNFTYKALRGEDGIIYGIHHSAIDVTEQVMARIKVEESVQQVRAIVESAPFPIAVYTGSEMRVELANQSIMDIWGKGNGVIGKLFTEVLPELENQEVFKQIAQVFSTGISFHTRHQRLDLVVNGKLRPYWFNYSFTPLFDATGNVYAVMNTGVDNTDLILAKQKVEENEKNIRNTILKAPVAMCIFRGPEHVVEIANERMIALWGRSVKDVMNKPIFVGLPEAKDQGFEQILDSVFNTGEAFVAQGVPVALPRDGKIETVYVNFVYEAFHEADNSISGIIAVATDVTDQMRARQQIEEVVAARTKELATANADLQRTNAELAQFAYIASHDLQEPVRKVSTFAQMLEQSLGTIDDRSKSYLEKINSSASRMTALIRDVLAYSQLSKEQETFIPVPLEEVVENIKTDFELLIEQKGANIVCAGLPIIEAIPIQMAQLFGNLISNALKFTRADVQPNITVTATVMPVEQIIQFTGRKTDSVYYNIEVRDNGIGFDPEFAEKIFSIFQRLHRRSEYEGTGIGLAMCKKIAQNHHGAIRAAGSENGAAFNVILPAKQGS